MPLLPYCHLINWVGMFKVYQPHAEYFNCHLINQAALFKFHHQPNTKEKRWKLQNSSCEQCLSTFTSQLPCVDTYFPSVPSFCSSVGAYHKVNFVPPPSLLPSHSLSSVPTCQSSLSPCHKTHIFPSHFSPLFSLHSSFFPFSGGTWLRMKIFPFSQSSVVANIGNLNFSLQLTHFEEPHNYT